MKAAIRLESPRTEITSNSDSVLALQDGNIFKNGLICGTETLLNGLLTTALNSLQESRGQMEIKGKEGQQTNGTDRNQTTQGHT